MQDSGLWIGKIEGRLAASEYLMRIAMARLLKVDVEGRDFVLNQLRNMIQQLGAIKAENDVSQAYINAERSVLQQLVDDFNKGADGPPPVLTVIPGGKSDD